MNKKTLKFLIPSLFGMFLFITPVAVNGDLTIPIAAMTKFMEQAIKDVVPYIALFFVSLSVVGGLFVRFARSEKLRNNQYLKALFFPGKVWLCVRILGAVFSYMIFFRIGPEWIWSETTGGVVFEQLFPILFSVFFLAGMFVPLLLNFGLLEFVGTVLSKVMRPLFKLPGRSSIVCMASWLGDGTIGILLTSKQYVDGYYTEREAAVIGTTFSAVSITFCLVVIETVGLGSMFLPFYATVTVAGVVAAVIMPRIPPLSRKKDVYYNNIAPTGSEEVVPKGYNYFSWGIYQAVERANRNKSVGQFLKEGVKNVLDMWVGVLPIVLAVGTVALIIAEHTEVFQLLGKPFIPLLDVLGVPESQAASEAILVGFADMFIPSILASANITSEMTRFIIASLSVTQLIFMAEVGGLLLGSKIPVSMFNLIVIFIERTLITLPIIVLFANIFF